MTQSRAAPSEDPALLAVLTVVCAVSAGALHGSALDPAQHSAARHDTAQHDIGRDHGAADASNHVISTYVRTLIFFSVAACVNLATNPLF